MVFMQSGSTMDTFATMALHLSDFLSPFSGLVRTANPFPSEPVPQVVGISTSGSAVSLTQAKIQPHLISGGKGMENIVSWVYISEDISTSTFLNGGEPADLF